MNILILGDIVGPSGREALIKKLPNLIKKKKLDFVVVNGENAADPGVGSPDPGAGSPDPGTGGPDPGI